MYKPQEMDATRSYRHFLYLGPVGERISHRPFAGCCGVGGVQVGLHLFLIREFIMWTAEENVANTCRY